MTVSQKDTVSGKKTASKSEAVLTDTEKTKPIRKRKPRAVLTDTEKPKTVRSRKANQKKPLSDIKLEKRHIVTVVNLGKNAIYIDFLRITVNSKKCLKLYGLNDLQLKTLERFIDVACTTGSKLTMQIEE